MQNELDFDPPRSLAPNSPNSNIYYMWLSLIAVFFFSTVYWPEYFEEKDLNTSFWNQSFPCPDQMP